MLAVMLSGCNGSTNIDVRLYSYDEKGNYIPNVFVNVYDEQGLIVASGKTNENGYTDFELQRPEQYEFFGNKEGYESASVKQNIYFGNNKVSLYLKEKEKPATNRYYEGETIEEIRGKGEYEGKKLKIKIKGIVYTAKGEQEVTLILYDQKNNTIDVRTVKTGDNLKDHFKDEKDDEILKDNIYITKIEIDKKSKTGYIETKITQ